MKKPGERRKLFIESLIAVSGGQGGTYTHGDVWQEILKKDPEASRTSFNSFMTKQVIDPGHAKRVKKVGMFWLFRLMTVPPMSRRKGYKAKKVKTKAARKNVVIHESTPKDPDEIDALTFGEKMFIWMADIRQRAITGEADLKQANERVHKRDNIIRGLQEQLTKASNKVKELQGDSKNKVSYRRFKDLQDENDRLKRRLDEQNTEIQRLNQRQGGSRFNLGNMARIKTQ